MANEMIERAKAAMLDEMTKQSNGKEGVYVGGADEIPGTVMVDGRVDLEALVRVIIEAMCIPAPFMIEAGFADAKENMDDMLPEDLSEAYTKMIDAALKD